eukprot:TRINITY_DN789_c0_g1_i4.p1 TRINITY_DN789_c0_g1~~TRINITY_DN789_c0_g1_i4.p1  ORF type:complete len:132 (-),score=37.06 TRINITY_DN789_c0_g1_i4:91-486(-)
MNFFFFWINDENERELVTCPLTDGTILPGVTRDSALAITRKWGEFKVSERYVEMKSIARAIDEGRMIEAFGTGTAAVVSPVCLISYEGKDYKIPLNPKDATSQAGPLAQRIYDELTQIQYGEVPSPWSYVV